MEACSTLIYTLLLERRFIKSHETKYTLCYVKIKVFRYSITVSSLRERRKWKNDVKIRERVGRDQKLYNSTVRE